MKLTERLIGLGERWIGWQVKLTERVGDWLGNLQLGNKKLGCWFGQHQGQWEYTDASHLETLKGTKPCTQYLAICHRCGRKGAYRTRHAWGEWYDRGLFRADERRCNRCRKTERQRTSPGGPP